MPFARNAVVVRRGTALLVLLGLVLSSLKGALPSVAQTGGPSQMHLPLVLRGGPPSQPDKDSLTAVNSVMPGGWEQQWPEFVKRNWNKPPVDDYTKWDGMAMGPALADGQALTLNGGGYSKVELPRPNVPHLAARYYHYTVADSRIRSLAFENPFARGSFPTARMQAIYKLVDGSWAVDDWTAKEWRPFCRDYRAERIMELVLVISNHEWQDRAHKLNPASPPRLHFSNVACRGWKVEAEAATIQKAPSWEWTGVVKTTATFARLRPENIKDFHVEFYRVADGVATWTYGGHTGLCEGSGSGSYTVGSPYNPHTMIVENYGIPFGIPTIPPAELGTRRYTASGLGPETGGALPLVNVACPDGSTYGRLAEVLLWLQTDRDVQMQRSITADGTTITGNLSWTQEAQVGTTERRFTWKMTALPPE